MLRAWNLFETYQTHRTSRKFLSMFDFFPGGGGGGGGGVANAPRARSDLQRRMQQAYTKLKKRAFNALLTCLQRAPSVFRILHFCRHARRAFGLYASV